MENKEFGCTQPEIKDCACDCFSKEIFDELEAMAKESNTYTAKVAGEVMALGLAAMKVLERQKLLPAKHGTKPARKGKLSGVGV